MSEIFKRLKEAEKKRNKGAVLGLDHDDTDDTLGGLTEAERERMSETLFEERIAQAGPIRVEVTCPECKKSISLRFRLKMKSQGEGGDGGKTPSIH